MKGLLNWHGEVKIKGFYLLKINFRQHGEVGALRLYDDCTTQPNTAKTNQALSGPPNRSAPRV